MNVEPIIRQFEVEGILSSFEPITIGHINDTILVKTEGEESPDYVLQRINHNIFRDVDKLMENILRVTTHITDKLALPDGIKKKKTLELVRGKNNKYYYRDAEGNYWRCYVYCQNGTAQFPEITPTMAFEGGRALGKFQSLLADLPGGPLHDTIPDFHNIEKRLMAFNDAVEQDTADRCRFALDEIKTFRHYADEMMMVHRLGLEGKLPMRITHNDTKFNNILFDENENALCIIDLDTVMNGYVVYDFGDAIRTLANTTTEDEADLTKVGFNFGLYEEFSKGYLKEAGWMLTNVEIENLAFSARLMTYIVALRFLTDYLEGDVYYKTAYPEHNLVRSRNQLALFVRMTEIYEKMDTKITEITDSQLKTSLLK